MKGSQKNQIKIGNEKGNLIISILFTNLTISQVKFEANVSKETLGINENLKLILK